MIKPFSIREGTKVTHLCQEKRRIKINPVTHSFKIFCITKHYRNFKGISAKLNLHFKLKAKWCGPCECLVSLLNGLRKGKSVMAFGNY